MASFARSYFEPAGVPLATARGGNVIGGGDFSRDRIVADIVRAARGQEQVVLRHPELVHDETIWHAFTEDIFVRMGGPQAIASDCATEIERGWERSENFELYQDVLPVLHGLRAYSLKLGLVSNGIRDLSEFVAHHRLDVAAIVDSRSHGWVKPHPTIFRTALDRLGVGAEEAAMVGDSLAEDVEGARALGLRAVLVDREDRHPDVGERVRDLYTLPAALGLVRPAKPS